jgi:Na+/citrate or Na+/malate symporter
MVERSAGTGNSRRLWRGICPARLGHGTTVAAMLLSMMAGMYLLVEPIYAGGSTLVAVNGWPALLLLLMPILICGAILVLRRNRLVRWARGLATVLLFGFVLGLGPSIGLFYLPCALAMLAATATDDRA